MTTVNLEEEAKLHFNKLAQSLEYHEKRLNDAALHKGIKYQIEREIAAIKFIMENAKENLAQKGIEV